MLDQTDAPYAIRLCFGSTCLESGTWIRVHHGVPCGGGSRFIYHTCFDVQQIRVVDFLEVELILAARVKNGVRLQPAHARQVRSPEKIMRKASVLRMFGSLS